jgi:hypothetical protein
MAQTIIFLNGIAYGVTTFKSADHPRTMFLPGLKRAPKRRRPLPSISLTVRAQEFLVQQEAH